MTNIVHDPDRPFSSGTIVLDARSGDDYLAGHWPGAIHVPVGAWEALAKTAGSGLDNRSEWIAAIGALGVDGSAPVAVYDDGRMTEAARVWFILQLFGVPVSIVNGGWPALLAAGAATETAAASRPAVAFVSASHASRVGLSDRQSLRSELNSTTRIVDARTSGEYDGRDLRRNNRGGHLPGARNIGHAELLGPQNWLKPADELRRIFAKAGLKSGERIVTHCDGGGRAALAAIAALQAGFTDVNAYYLSFADWAKDESCPVVLPVPAKESGST